MFSLKYSENTNARVCVCVFDDDDVSLIQDVLVSSALLML